MVLGKGANTTGVANKVSLLVLGLLLCLSSHSWGACQPNPYWANQLNDLYRPSGYNSVSCYNSSQMTSCHCYEDDPCVGIGNTGACNSHKSYCSNGESLLNSSSAGGCPPTRVAWPGVYTGAVELCGTYSGGCNPNGSGCAYQYVCDNKCEADSVRFGGIILECQYDIVEQKWYKWTCTGGSSCSGGYCIQEYYNDESLCKEKYCEDNPSGAGCPNACEPFYEECLEYGGKWEGRPTSDSTCASTCDLCNTPQAKAFKEYQYNTCCEGGLTPYFKCGFEGLPSTVSGMIWGDIISSGCNTASWETNKICEEFYSSAAEESSSSSSAESSSSSVSDYCRLFPDDLSCICAADSTHPDCDYLRSSSSGAPGSSGDDGGMSSEGEGTSSGEGGEGTSSGEGGGGDGDDWEYNYNDSLHKLIKITARTATTTDEIETNTQGIWSLLKMAKCLFTDCTDYDGLKDALDTNIAIPDGDTAGVIASMLPLDSTMQEFIDRAEAGDIYGIGSDSINDALLQFGDKVGGIYSDSGIYDEMYDLAEMTEDYFPTSQWSGGGCPAAISSNVSFDLPFVGNVNTGRSLGYYVCSPLPVLRLSLGETVRAILRLLLTIYMAFGIFKTATGYKDD